MRALFGHKNDSWGSRDPRTSTDTSSSPHTTHTFTMMMTMRRRNGFARYLQCLVALSCLMGRAACFRFLPCSFRSSDIPSGRKVQAPRQRRSRLAAVDHDVADETKIGSMTSDIHPSSPSDSNVAKRGIVLATGLASLATVSSAAKVGLLQGLPFADGSGFAPYTDAMIAQDAACTVLTGVLAAIYTKGISFLASRDILDPTVSRKLIHTFAAPLFVFFWPIYTAAPGARFFAATVTLVNMLRLFLAAQGDVGEAELAKAVSRSGDLKEVLGGPFLYVTVITASILAFWRSNLIGVMAISIMAAGDGMADLVGRRFGKNNKWFFSQDKSIVGSLAFVISGSLCAVGLAAWLSFTGCLELPLPIATLVPRIALVSFICAVVELLPVGDDNWTVPLSAAILSMLFL